MSHFFNYGLLHALATLSLMARSNPPISTQSSFLYFRGSGIAQVLRFKVMPWASVSVLYTRQTPRPTVASLALKNILRQVKERENKTSFELEVPIVFQVPFDAIEMGLRVDYERGRMP
ncbi:hypothetical protein V8E54_000542 [Elaphomyces granulatus]